MTLFVYLFTCLVAYLSICGICVFIGGQIEDQPEQLGTEQGTPTDQGQPIGIDEDLRLVQGGNCVAVVLRNNNPLGFDNVITKR